MYTNSPINAQGISDIITRLNIPNIGNATIREVVMTVNTAEAELGDKFVRMEMGVPSLEPPKVGVEAEKAALDAGVASKYPMLDGLPALKQEAARFVEAFLGNKVNSNYCIPTVGSMQGTYASFLTCLQSNPEKDTILFVDPGFPVQKQQLDVLGGKVKTFDVYEYRGEKLAAKLDDMLSSGDVCCIVYSNPNNPSWICFNDEELKIIAEKADKYDAVVLEDLAYFGMDFRKDLGQPFQAPYQATVAQYTDNYIQSISSSKAFSYAGQRIGVTVISDKVFERQFAALKERYGIASFGGVFVGRVLYALSSGVSHSAQYALAAMLKAASDGEYTFLEDVKIYGERAKVMKKLFIENGFHLVYDKDLDEDIADGFYFTVGYKDMKGADLAAALVHYGISSISLDSTGSLQQGIRACTAFVLPEQFATLEERLVAFAKDNN